MNRSLSFFRSSPKLITSTILIGAPIIYLIHTHSRLSRLVHHTIETGPLTIKETTNIASIPEAILKEQCFITHDIASKPVQKALLPYQDANTLLTTYLRHTMVRFSSFPHAYLLRLLANRSTFRKSYLENLDFKEGDIVCGLYQVALRTDEKVEFAMKQGTVEGRLVVGIRDAEGEEKEIVVFYSETVMWKGKDDRSVMPLERRVPKWLHELASWWLLESGTGYLVGLKKGS